MSSLTLVLSGDSSSLRANYFPPIELDPRSSYECCLVDFHTYNTIPNINEMNNKLHLKFNSKTLLEPTKFESNSDFLRHVEALMKSSGDKKWSRESLIKLDWLAHLSDYHDSMGGDLSLTYSIDKVIEIPVGSYEMDDIINILSDKLDVVYISYDKNTARTTIKIEDDNVTVDFTQPESIRNVLGYGSRVLEGKMQHVGEYPINISTINAVRVECILVTDSFINGRNSHTIHEFYPSVAPGYKIVEVPKNLIYLPIVDRTIHALHIDIVDQNGNLIDFRGETITCRIYIRKV